MSILYSQYCGVQELPTASVVIVFHNEGFSTLLRTVHSVIDQSPPRLLHEVVMVDDFSDKAPLKERLELYIKQFNGKVSLLLFLLFVYDARFNYLSTPYRLERGRTTEVTVMAIAYN